MSSLSRAVLTCALVASTAAPRVVAQDPPQGSGGVYTLPQAPVVRSGVVQKVGPAAPKPDIVVMDLSLNEISVASPAVTLTADQAGWTVNGKCLFILGYHLKNAGGASTQSVLPSFVTQVTVAGPVPSAKAQSGFALSPGQVQSVQAQVWLVPGLQTVTVFADPNDTIPEVSETNNQRGVRVTLTGTCDRKNPNLNLPALRGPQSIDRPQGDGPETTAERNGIIVNDKQLVPGGDRKITIQAKAARPGSQGGTH